MDLRIDPSHAVPIYAQVVEQVKALVATGALRPGDAVPSVRELAARLRINRNTASKAYQMLEAEGVLETRKGQGTFVANGVSRWSESERRGRIERSLDRSIVEAYHLELPFDALPPLLAERIERFRRPPRDDEEDKR